MRDHVILCGLGRVGRRVLEYLRVAGMAVVAIDEKIDAAREAVANPGVTFLRGDFRQRDLLEQAGLAHARGILILSSDDLTNLSSMMTVLHLRPGMRVVVRMFNPQLVARLGPVTANTFALSTSALTAPMLALTARTGGALASFKIKGQRSVLISVWNVPHGHSLAGKPAADLVRTRPVQVVARQPSEEHCRFWKDADLAAPLRPGERVIVCGPADQVAELTGEAGRDASAGLLRFGEVRRTFRMCLRVFAEVDLPVKITTAILFGVIISSVMIFTFGLKEETTIDAFYRTISLMATGAEMRVNDVEPGSWQKAFISLLRLVGAALTAAFTAILTNYLVRAQLRGALEVRRIPEAGHVVLTGLGNVGFRVLEELLRLGERVVAIERNRDNPFIPTARRLGAAVIVGDAMVQEVLRQAHAATAKSIVAATQHELTNLEIGLLIRELHPKKRVVVRLIDSQLAQMLRDAANFRLALSIPELAAPAIVAALLGDRIRTVVFAEGQLLAVVDLTVQAIDPMQGRTVSDLTASYHFLPVALTVAGEARFDNFGSVELETGHILTVILSFRDLSALFQRDLPRRAPALAGEPHGS